MNHLHHKRQRGSFAIEAAFVLLTIIMLGLSFYIYGQGLIGAPGGCTYASGAGPIDFGSSTAGPFSNPTFVTGTNFPMYQSSTSGQLAGTYANATPNTWSTATTASPNLLSQVLVALYSTDYQPGSDNQPSGLLGLLSAAMCQANYIPNAQNVWTYFSWSDGNTPVGSP